MKSNRRPDGATRGKRLAAACVLCVLLSGCAGGAAVQPPRDVPAAFQYGSLHGGSWPAQDWYRGFGSQELNGFVELAVSNNGDLAAARERVLQADARARQAGAALLPSVDGNANGNFLAGHSQQGSGHELDWSTMLSASYEVDFWGKNRATAQSARLLAGGARAERDAVALTALAGVANGYFELLAVRERLAVARSNRDNAQKVLEVVLARFDAGVASPVELAAQKAALDTAQIALSDLQQSE